MAPEEQGKTGVMVTLDEIYRQVLNTDDKVDKLASAVGEMVAINHRLDQHHSLLNNHETRIVSTETYQAIHAATARPRTPWYITVAAIGGIITAIGALFSVVVILGKVSQALGG